MLWIILKNAYRTDRLFFFCLVFDFVEINIYNITKEKVILFSIIFLLFEILPFVIIPVVFISVGVRAYRVKNKPNKDLPKFERTISNANDPNSFANSNEDLSISCDYCGSKLERVRKRCPACGARVQKHKQ